MRHVDVVADVKTSDRRIDPLREALRFFDAVVRERCGLLVELGLVELLETIAACLRGGKFLACAVHIALQRGNSGLFTRVAHVAFERSDAFFELSAIFVFAIPISLACDEVARHLIREVITRSRRVRRS